MSAAVKFWRGQCLSEACLFSLKTEAICSADGEKHLRFHSLWSGGSEPDFTDLTALVCQSDMLVTFLLKLVIWDFRKTTWSLHMEAKYLRLASYDHIINSIKWYWETVNNYRKRSTCPSRRAYVQFNWQAMNSDKNDKETMRHLWVVENSIGKLGQCFVLWKIRFLYTKPATGTNSPGCRNLRLWRTLSLNQKE